jgi:hypothetical protein
MSERANVKVVGVFVPDAEGSLNSLENPFARDCGPKLLGEARLLSAASNLGPCCLILVSLGLFGSDLTCPRNADIDGLDD